MPRSLRPSLRHALVQTLVGGLCVVALASACSSSTPIDVAARVEVTPPVDDEAAARTPTSSAEDRDADTTGEAHTVADPTSTAVPVRSRAQQSAPAGAQTYTSIRDVDFMDGFTYETELDFGSPTATVTEGSFENGEFGDPDYYWFGVNRVDFGDLDGDGSEDALVVTAWNGGGSGYFDSVRAFRLVDGQVETAGIVPFGDRADGGIADVRIDGDLASVWSFSTTLGACCPNEVRRNTLVLGEHWLAKAEATSPRTWMALGSSQRDSELKFIPGTSSAVVAVYGWELEGAFTFDAARGQRLTIALTQGPAAETISVTSLTTGQVLSGLPGTVLPADGLYQVTITFDGERADNTTFDVIIGDGETALPISWSPATEQQVITEEPYVTSSLLWPVFAPDQPGTGAANDALAAFVAELDDAWIEDVTEFSTPLDDSSYDVRYEVTLATSEIASVRFDYYDYVCCRPYPNYGPISAVLDLQAGRLIPVDEILDMSRFDEINRLWLDELKRQDLLPETAEALLGGQSQFESLTLLPEGVEFGTSRNALGGGFPGTQTVVGYEQLGTLVNSELVARISDR